MGMIKQYVHKEVITPIVILAVLIIYVSSALNLSPPIRNGLLQESFFPLLIFVISVPVTVKLFIEAVQKYHRSDSSKKDSEKKDFSIKPFLIALITILLILGFEPLGFVITAPLYVFSFMLVYDDKPQKILRKIIYALLVTAFVYVLYAIVFDIRFPQIWS